MIWMMLDPKQCLAHTKSARKQSRGTQSTKYPSYLPPIACEDDVNNNDDSGNLDYACKSPSLHGKQKVVYVECSFDC